MRVSLKVALVGVGLTFCSWSVSSAQAPAPHKTTAHSAGPADLEGREWHIFNYSPDHVQTWHRELIREKTKPYIKFAGRIVEGSPGCGRFTGEYHRSGKQVTVLSEWVDSKEAPCGNEKKEEAKQILKALTNVRRILVEPSYWHEDALLLTDARGSDQVNLLPMQPGKDLSELEDTFWHLTQLQNSSAKFSAIVVEIRSSDIFFSTPSYSTSFTFGYKLTGLDFPLTSANWNSTRNNRASRRIATIFGNVLNKISSYELSQGGLTFFGENHQSVMVLTAVRQVGIENRRWRIAKFRPDSSQQGDADGLVEARQFAEITFLNGQVEGSPSCGAWAGTYQLFGDRLTVQAGMLLFGICEPEEFAQSPFVVSDFQGQLKIEEKGNNILLRDKSGKARALLVPY